MTSIEKFPELRSLGIGDDELDALRRQGYLELDMRRGTEAGYWRLRFRHQQSLRTVYLGNRADRLAHVRRELSQLQSSHCRRRELSRRLEDAKQETRNMKMRLEPILRRLGYHSHGSTIRKFAIPPQSNPK